MKTIFFTIIICVSFLSIEARQQNSTLKLRADSLFLSGNYLSAINTYDSLAKRAFHKKEWEICFTSKSRIIECNWRLGKLKEAEILANELASETVKILGSKNLYSGQANLHLGVINLIQANLNASETYFIKTLKIYRKHYGEEHPEVNNVFYNLGVVKKKNGHIDSAIYYFNKTLEYDKEEFGLDNIRLTDHYTNLGSIYQDIGFFEKVKLYYDSAFLLYKKANKTNHPIAAVTYANMGANYCNMGRFEKGISFLFKALKIFEEYYSSSHYRIIATYKQIGVAYFELENFNLAKKYAKKAIQLNREGNSNYTSEVEFYNFLGAIYLNQNQLDSSIFFLDKAEAISKASANEALLIAVNTNKCLNFFLQRKPNRALMYYNWLTEEVDEKSLNYFETTFAVNNAAAEYYLKQNDFVNASKYVEVSIAANSSNELSKDIFKKYIDPHQMLNSLVLKAGINKEKGDLLSLKESLAVYKACDRLLNNIRQYYSSFRDRDFLTKNYSDFYENAITVAYELYQLTDSSKYLNRGFIFSESSRANELFQSNHISAIKSAHRLPDSLRLKETEIMSLIQYYNSVIIREKSDSSFFENNRIDKASGFLVDLQEQKEVFIKHIEEHYPEYFRFKYKGYQIGIEEVRRLLGINETLVEYFAGDSISFCFIVNAEKKYFLKLPPIKSIELIDMLEAGTGNYTSEKLREFQKYSNEVYRQVFEPVEKILSDEDEQLIIVPDGALNVLPFDLLVAENPEDREVLSTESYLINKYQLSYAYAARMMKSTSEVISYNDKFLAIAPSYSTEQFNDSDFNKFPVLRKEKGVALKWNVDEVKAIAVKFNTLLMIEKEATELNFKKHAVDYKYIHIAGHAFNDLSNPEMSNLLFSSEADTVEDGRLYSYELANMNLSAELAVLSACNTGGGDVNESGDMTSIGYFFQLAGAKSVIMSQWSVDDKSTRVIMEKFYEKLQNGLDKRKALRAAKLEFITESNPILVNPFYWAPFVIYGDVGKLEEKSFSYNSGWGIAAFALVMLLIIMTVILKLQLKKNPSKVN